MNVLALLGKKMHREGGNKRRDITDQCYVVLYKAHEATGIARHVAMLEHHVENFPWWFSVPQIQSNIIMRSNVWKLGGRSTLRAVF